MATIPERAGGFASLKTYVDKLAAEIRRQGNIKVGPGLRLNSNPGGITISLAAQPQQVIPGSKSESRTSAGGLIELHRAWTNTIHTWRLNERVVYKPAGSGYHLVYQCNDATATTTDIPGISTKWTRITNWTNEPYWDKGATYPVGSRVLYLGAIYAAAVESNGTEPGTDASKWTKTADSLIGITSYPMQIDDKDVFTPYAEYYQYDTRYEATDDPNLRKLCFGQRKVERYLDGTTRVSVVGDLVEFARAVPHS